MSLDDPVKTKEALDRMKEVSVAFGVAQIEDWVTGYRMTESCLFHCLRVKGTD
jgi:hypothetical protein